VAYGRRLAPCVLTLLWLAAAFTPRAQAQDHAAVVDFDVVVEAPAALRQVMERSLDIRRWRDSGFVTSALLEELLVDALEQAWELAATEGYFGAAVDGHIDSSVQPQRVRIRVDPGQAARIASVTLNLTGPVTSDPTAAARLDDLRANWRLTVGAVFRQEDWTRAISAAVSRLASVSYASARVSSSLAQVDEALQNVDLQVEIDSGPPFFFGEVTALGLVRYGPSLVERLAPFDPGTPFTQELLRRFEQRLVLTGYFSTVQTVIDTDPARAAAVPVSVAVIEAPRRRVDVGVGYSTDTLARFNIAYVDNDRGDQPLRRRAELRLESLQQDISVAFDGPPGKSGWISTYSATALRTDIQDLETEELLVGLQRRRLGERSEPAFGIEATIERQTRLGAPSEDVHAALIGYQHTWRMVDEVLAPTDGWALRINAGFAPPAISTESFGRLVARGSYYWPLNEQDHLYLRSDLGWVMADSRAGVPQYFLFRTGGDSTIRGYEFQSIGVQQDGAIVGGRYLAVASVEYIRWIRSSWGVATFIDAGDATDEPGDFRVVTGYGLGARVRSPVGAFRLDLAYGHDVSSLRLHFSFGLRF